MPDYSKQILEQCEGGLIFKHLVGKPRELTKSDKFKLFLNRRFFCRFDVQIYKSVPLPENKGETIKFRRYPGKLLSSGELNKDWRQKTSEDEALIYTTECKSCDSGMIAHGYKETRCSVENYCYERRYKCTKCFDTLFVLNRDTCKNDTCSTFPLLDKDNERWPEPFKPEVLTKESQNGR